MNAISVLYPYKYEGLWVFDDSAAGLDKEPFVCGIDKMIDRLVVGLQNPDKGFRLYFAPEPFPGFAVQLEWRRPEYGGNWYYCAEYEMEGWLCPALFRYFVNAPKRLFAKAEAKN